jgi:hypothetical protein
MHFDYKLKLSAISSDANGCFCKTGLLNNFEFRLIGI